MRDLRYTRSMIVYGAAPCAARLTDDARIQEDLGNRGGASTAPTRISVNKGTISRRFVASRKKNAVELIVFGINCCVPLAKLGQAQLIRAENLRKLCADALNC